MRKVILSLAVSFDGYIEGPNKEIDWIEFSPESATALGKFMQEIDTILYGRVSYEAWGNYVPTEESPDFIKEFYDITAPMKKYVFSTTKNSFEGNPIVVQDNIAETIEELKRQPGKNIWLYGGGSLITTFLNLDLVDEFQLAICPVILSAGTPLFKDINHRIKLDLREVSSGNGGIISITYERRKS